MPALEESAITLLSTTTGVDMQAVASTPLYVVPAGKTLYVDAVVIRDLSASLAGGTDYDMTNWQTTMDLSGITVVGSYTKLYTSGGQPYTPSPGATVINWVVNTGSTAACTATLELYGHLA